MLDFLRGDGDGPNLLAGTFKLALALAALGYLAAHSLSSERLDYKGLSRLASDVTKKFPDPAVTGSVLQSARSTRVDPCVAQILTPTGRAARVQLSGFPGRKPSLTPSPDIQRLLEIMAALRTPGSGCPWDLEQTFTTIAPYTIEEAYEVADAVERGDLQDLKEELGDLLLQVVFHARMAEEAGIFDFGDVVEAITTKLIRRHPHVFGDARDLSADEVKSLWDKIKGVEKAERRRDQGSEGDTLVEPGLLTGVPRSLPALTRAGKLTAQAATVGFDWPNVSQVVDKIHEEIREVEQAVAAGGPDRIEDEIGDLLFAAANLARHFRIDPETALRGANAKFQRRFQAIEQALAEQGRSPDEAGLDEMERLWNEAKAAERAGTGP
jgi:ATP diphosphatase